MKYRLPKTIEECGQGVLCEDETRSVAEAEGLPSRRRG